jgi:hypothetical protein
MWKYNLEPDRPQMAIWSMRIACCITNATDRHSEYVILVFHGKSDARMHLNVAFVLTLPALLVATFKPLTMFWDHDGRMCARFLY